ncbi:hypothetical protein M758_11G067300 [Ceratodon purpureus]|uniref:Uncharacterized protein n=1 Tax=Ceratodon purpureus TaxID=3225 RepID=A0A8T0GC12_CERPU|nr:hypothetical protein KC19_11G069200 [Ceratodon purpureus]KAG0600867.1 hypothetical protein M758_11G067300 [Ceratodon purpureus]
MASHAGVPFRSSQVISYSKASLLIMLGELTSSTPHNHLLYSLFVGLLFSCIERLKTFMSGLLRCGKSCRLRWMNYLRPDLKRGVLTEAEENLVLELHSTLGNRWSRIAVQLPGRTDNEIKNFWNTRLKKRLRNMGMDPNTHKAVESSGTDGDTETVDSKEEHSCSTLASHNFERSQDQSVAPASQFSQEVAAQLKSFEGEAARNVLKEMNLKSEPICTNLKQSKSGLQSSSTDFELNAKLCKVASSPNHLEKDRIPSLHCNAQDGVKLEVEEDLFTGDLHPHARHQRQEEYWLSSMSSTDREHELALTAGTSIGLSEGLTASSGIFQELATSTGSILFRQSSGFSFSDMAAGNWSFLGDIHGQSASGYGSTSTIPNSWNDFHGFNMQLPGAGRPLQEPELQKLAAILDQI